METVNNNDEIDKAPNGGVPGDSRQPNELPQNELADVTGVDERCLYAAMSYLLLLVLIPIFNSKRDSFINFHIRQGIVVSVGLVVAIILANWLSWLGSILFLLLFITDIVALVLALQGRQWKIPLVGWLAGKFSV